MRYISFNYSSLYRFRQAILVSYMVNAGSTMLEREKEALPVLRHVPQDSVWREPARWYEANALIGLGEWKAAGRLLRTLSAENGEYSDRATLLVQRLGDGS